MKALTLTQPYATLVAIKQKHIETRSWATRYRGPLAIHAAQGLAPVGGPMGLVMLCVKSPFVDVLTAHGITLPDLPRGAIVAVCELTGCWPTSGEGYQTEIGDDVISFNHWHKVSDQERAFGDYTLGRYAWLLSDIRALPEPIPAKGAQGLWNWEVALS
jgi:hypothetical protein